jgi:hypothetical protein
MNIIYMYEACLAVLMMNNDGTTFVWFSEDNLNGILTKIKIKIKIIIML